MARINRILVLVLVIAASVLGAAAQNVVVSVDAAGRFKIGKKPVTLSRLGKGLTAALDGQASGDRIVYVKAGSNVPFSQIRKLLKAGRTIKQDSFGLMMATEDAAAAVMTKIALDSPDDAKPNPLILVVGFKTNGGLSLNNESLTPVKLTKKLNDIFVKREYNGVTRPGTNEVERTVSLDPSAATTFGAIVKAARLVKEGGAEPIVIATEGH